ncbi:MAG: hypothetical protein NTV51_20140 [Verrucomicrobia bacterium]|nr:hypothetical protein [Verrucomicrobiota bacterium]
MVIVENGSTYTASSTVTAIVGTTAGAITAPATAATAVGANAPTITVSVPAAQNGDRTFRWSVTGDAVVVSGQNAATATIRPGTAGLKEVTCDVTLQRLATVSLRSYLVVNGDGPPVTVTINNGTGGGTYNGNSRVDIFADPPPPGQVFDRWTGTTTVFGANAPLAPLLAHNLITVPATPVTLTATYKAAPAWTLTTVNNFNPQPQPSTSTLPSTPATTTTVSTTLLYYLPSDAIGLVFLVHDTGSSAAAWFETPEGALLTRDLVAAGYGVAALNSLNRTAGTWSAATTLNSNLDALNHVAALNKFLRDAQPAAMKPIFFLGLAEGATAAARYADFLATANPARNVRGTVLYCAAGLQTLAVTSKVPQYFALAANDDVLGTAGLAAARSNAQLLAGRGLASGSVTNAVSPVHPGRFRTLGVSSPAFTTVDATAIWTAVKTAGFLDANNYLKATPTTAALTAALPEAHRTRTADVAAELAAASAAPGLFSEATPRVLAFLNARVAGTPAPAPGRIVNLSTRSKIAYVEDSFSVGFSLAGPDRATVLVRGVGPGLARFGVTGALAAPRLEVYDSAGRLVAANERWDLAGGAATPAQLATATTTVGAFALNAGSLDTAVLLTNLPAGPYTATIKGVNGAIGDVLAEVYDVTRNNTRLANLSTLGKIATNGDLLIPGIVVQGTSPRTLIVRAIGPGLSAFGLPANAVLTDPTLSVHNAAGATLDSNNNWTLDDPATLSAAFLAAGAFPLKTANAADAALVTSVNPGNYTLQAGSSPTAGLLPGGANQIGSVLVEVYEVP